MKNPIKYIKEASEKIRQNYKPVKYISLGAPAEESAWEDFMFNNPHDPEVEKLLKKLAELEENEGYLHYLASTKNMLADYLPRGIPQLIAEYGATMEDWQKIQDQPL